MKTILIAIATASLFNLSAFAAEGEQVSKTSENCMTIDAVVYTKEFCKVTDKVTKEVVRTEKTCYKAEMGAGGKVGPVSAAISLSKSDCTTITRPASTE